MRRGVVGVLVGAILAAGASLAAAAPPVPGGGAAAPAPPAHASSQLDCRNCHEGNHQGVVRMYIGTGGRGTGMIPSHMFQVRVECVACHVATKEPEATARLKGQTFRPSEQACLGCHAQRFRGMLGRWTETLARMQAIVAPKLVAARDAVAAVDPKSPAGRQARNLVDDAAFNIQFVELAKGVHNVFYAADLLKLANGWLDEAQVRAGKPPAKADDVLVRGGYCAVLCHEQAQVRRRETVTFRGLKVPHVRHVTEFGAVCTACHSAEVHKAVTATPATCASCHHSPKNERCESCHAAQSAFYRGTADAAAVKAAAPVKVEPNVMAAAVECTGCHDFSQRHSRRAVTDKCVGCHDAAYAGMAEEWTAGGDKDIAAAARALRQAETAVAAARRARRDVREADGALQRAREALALVRRVRPVHNPDAATALLKVVATRAGEAVQLAGATAAAGPAPR